MYPSAETRPGPRQATKINLFARIVDVFNWWYECLRGSDYTCDLFKRMILCALFCKQQFYKQCQTEIGKKSSKKLNITSKLNFQ